MYAYGFTSLEGEGVYLCYSMLCALVIADLLDSMENNKNGEKEKNEKQEQQQKQRTYTGEKWTSYGY